MVYRENVLLRTSKGSIKAIHSSDNQYDASLNTTVTNRVAPADVEDCECVKNLTQINAVINEPKLSDYYLYHDLDKYKNLLMDNTAFYLPSNFTIAEDYKVRKMITNTANEPIGEGWHTSTIIHPCEGDSRFFLLIDPVAGYPKNNIAVAAGYVLLNGTPTLVVTSGVYKNKAIYDIKIEQVTPCTYEYVNTDFALKQYFVYEDFRVSMRYYICNGFKLEFPNQKDIAKQNRRVDFFHPYNNVGLHFNESVVELRGPHIWNAQAIGVIRAGTKIEGGLMNFPEDSAYHIGSAPIDVGFRDKNYTPESEEVELFNPRIASNGIVLYKLTKQEAQDFFKSLWTTSFSEEIDKMFGKTQDGILGFKWFYGIENNIPTMGADFLRLGNTDLTYSGQTATGHRCVKEFVTHIIPDIPVAKIHNNFLDYAPYTQVDIFIPFYGYFSISPDACVGGQIQLEYVVSLFTGLSIVKIYTRLSQQDTYQLYDVINCVMSVEIPINVTAVETFETRLASRIPQLLTTVPISIGAGMATLGPAGAASGGLMAAYNALSKDDVQKFQTQAKNVIQDSNNIMAGSVFTNTDKTIRNGGFSSENSVMSGLRVKTVITTVQVSSKMSDIVGYASNRNIKLSNCKGYVQVAKLEPSGCPRHKEIEELLKQGVFI